MLGVNEDDVQSAERLMHTTTIQVCPKALRLLGTTKDEIDLENAKNLGSLGTSGRRRSYLTQSRQRQRSFALLMSIDMINDLRWVTSVISC